jgi:hypothetical protein
VNGQASERIRYSPDEIMDLSDSDARRVLVEVGVPRDHLLFGASGNLRSEVAASGRECLHIGEVGGGDELRVDSNSPSVRMMVTNGT